MNGTRGYRNVSTGVQSSQIVQAVNPRSVPAQEVQGERLNVLNQLAWFDHLIAFANRENRAA